MTALPWIRVDIRWFGPYTPDRGLRGGKPRAAMSALVVSFSDPGDYVCDPCAGHGTTLVAAIENGRHAMGAEPHGGRYDRALARIRRADQLLPGVRIVSRQRTAALSLI